MKGCDALTTTSCAPLPDQSRRQDLHRNSVVPANQNRRTAPYLRLINFQAAIKSESSARKDVLRRDWSEEAGAVLANSDFQKKATSIPFRENLRLYEA